MAPIPSCWHQGDIPLRPYDTPPRQAALVFALYGLRRQLACDMPGSTEATITITDTDGRSLGRLALDADDVARLSKAIGELLDQDFGPFERDQVERLISEYDNS